jgi:hypothetical protein
MARSDMEQLRQRVIATYHLEPMAREETEGYVKHRLTQVGWTGEPALTREAFDAIFAATGGLPRKIHKLCNRVLLFAAVENVDRIDATTVETVLADLIAEQAAAPSVEAAEEFKAVAPAPVEAPKAVEDIQPLAVEPVIEVKGDAPMPMAETAPETPAETAPMTAPLAGGSVFDRLKAGRAKAARTPAAVETPAPKSATLDDVATAIAAARVVQREHQTADIAARAADIASPVSAPPLAPRLYGTDAVDAGPVTEIDGDDDLNGEEGEDHPALADDPSAWRSSVVASINDTRDELRRAHQSVARLRRQLTEIDARRRRRREQIDASLGRAETLLSEIRNAWR